MAGDLPPHTGGHACRSRLQPYFPRTAPNKHAVRRRDQRGEARRPSHIDVRSLRVQQPVISLALCQDAHCFIS